MSLFKVDNEMQAEIERVRRETARRDREISHSRYGWQSPVNLLFHSHLVRACIAALSGRNKYPLDDFRVLDVGCGPGTWLLEFAQWGAKPGSIAGIDLDSTRIARAMERMSEADLRIGDAQTLPWPNESFDVVTQFTVFSSILDGRVKARMASEMRRVLRPGGLILWYYFRVNNPGNKSVKGIRIAEVRRLFPDCSVEPRSETLLPPLARAVVPVSWLAAEVLCLIPLLRSHYLAVIQPRRGQTT